MELHSKQDFQNLLKKLINPLKSLYSNGGALLDLGKSSANYDDHVAHLEGFARPLWGLAPFWAGGGRDKDFEEIYRCGLANGSNPKSPEFWGWVSSTDQRFVEMAAIGIGLILAPDKIWNPLSELEKNNLAQWLFNINLFPYHDSNWWFFEVLVNTGLRKVGKAYNQERLQEGLNHIERFYIGDGWYSDGLGSSVDYYNAFAIHYYSLIYSIASHDVDPERCNLYKERAGKFALDFLYWFDENGSALPYGRSLTYRFAQASFWSAYVLAGLNTVPLGVVKGIIVRHLQYWLESDMLDRDGILTIGYRYPNLHMAETYNAPGSPYWALKIFLVLALFDNHIFWNEISLPLPQLESLKHISQAKMLIQRGNDHVIAYPSGETVPQGLGHGAQKYAKFAYSTKFGFSVPHSAEYIHLAAPDNMLAFELDGLILIRRVSIQAKVDDEKVWSIWSPIKGITVESTIIPTDTGSKRKHIIYSEFNCWAYDCGFALPENIGGTANCIVGNGQPTQIIAAPNTSIMYSQTWIPAVKYLIVKGKNELETDFDINYKPLPRQSITDRISKRRKEFRRKNSK